ncbi:TatD family [Penicillium expansum]|nr:TatD family [Penicillium expansum]
MKFFDVAVTFTADQFQGIYRGKQYHEPDFAEVLKRARENGCEKIMLTTMTLEGAKQNLQAVREFPTMCKMTLGVHPYHAAEVYDQPQSQYLNELCELGETLLAENPSPLAAFGEIGLDYEYLDRADKETQQRAFREQLELAVQFQLPLFLHTAAWWVGAFFCGDEGEMLQLVELGLEISVNGVSFRTDEQLEMVRNIPLDKLQLETDAPWCEVLSNDPKIAAYLETARPLPASRKHNKFILGQMVKTRNESCSIERVGLVVAGLKGVTMKEVVEAAWNNSSRMFWL